jgi:glycine/D-amino acid oxidase-like deaminating enzyme
VTTRAADCVIIGGGITGVSTAFQLAGLGLKRVLVLEKKFVGAGGTGRSVGIIRQLYPTRETSQMVLRSLAVFERFGDAVGGASGFVRSGALIGVSAAMRPSLERTLALQRQIGVRAEIVEPADLKRIEPRIDPSGLGALLWEPGSGYGDPSAVTAGYADAARKRGALIEQGVEVTAIRQAGGRVVGVDTAAGDRIDAPIVINAAGLWSPRVARLAGHELPIIVGRHPVFIVERDAAFGPAHTVYLDLAGGAYARPETGGLTLTGSLTDDETSIPWMRISWARRRASTRRASPSPDGAGHPRHGRRALQAGLRGRLRYHAGLDAHPRRVASARPLRGGRTVGPRVQAGPRRRRDDGGPRHRLDAAGEPCAFPLGKIRR